MTSNSCASCHRHHHHHLNAHRKLETEHSTHLPGVGPASMSVSRHLACENLYSNRNYRPKHLKDISSTSSSRPSQQQQTSNMFVRTNARHKSDASVTCKSSGTRSRRHTASSIRRLSHRNDRINYYISTVGLAVLLILLQTAPATTSVQRQQLDSQTTTTLSSARDTTPSSYNHSRTTVISTAETMTTTLPHIGISTNDNQPSDINKRQVLPSSSEQQHQHQQQQHQPAIEQVAKAEALTASASPGQQQQQGSAKMFEVCKTQSRINQQLTNLSQIMFQPSDICSTWTKMIRTNSDSTTSDLYPWQYIEQLNLSHNNLTVLHDSSGMSRLVNLLDLKITHNQLSRCEESSLSGLQRLQILDLSHNKLMALPTKFFQPVKQTLKKLQLSFNSISVLVPTLFDSLDQLEYLDLSHNDITSHWINDRLFKNLTQLRYLDLSFNKLTVFSSPMTFSSLQQLETLSLQHNELRQVPETIQHLKYLSSLDLSQNFIHDITNASYLSNCRLLFNLNLESNILENITRDAFSDLPALKVLNLANNRIHHLDQQAFESVSDLHALRLDSNRLVDFGQAFVNLRFLLMLNISSNRISSFDYAQIPLGLQWLDLHSNKIDKLNNFFYTPGAQQQYSATNDIMSQQQGTLGQQWQSMLRLTTLDASFNLIRELDNTSLPESLETVQLNNNHIKIIASHTFSTKSNLTRINLSHNQITTLPFDALRLQGNRDSSSPQQKFVDIQLMNNPFVCNCNMGWLSQLLLASSNLLQGGGSNVIQSSTLPRDHTFTNIYALVLARHLPRVADAHLINCNLHFGRQTPFTADPHQWSPVTAANQLALHHNHHLHTREQALILKQSELLASVHLCPYKSHCFALCYCCDFDACDCEMSCPENCSCYYDQTWSTNIVDCSANNQINANSQARFTQMMMGAGGSGNHHHNHHSHHRQPSTGPLQQQQQQQQQMMAPQIVKFMNIPEKIPMDVTELYLDGLELLHLRGNALIGRRNLKSLYLNNSQLYSIEPKALATQKALKTLQLNSNFLTELHGYEFEQQTELRELYLANNRLTSIANSTFLPLKSLQILHLQNNQLYHFNFWSNVPTGHKLVSLNLGQNPWSCQCDHIEPMLQWLQMNIKHIHDRKSVSCQYNRTTSLHLISPSDDSLVPSIYGSTNENYPMFDKRMCLNFTVYPVQNQPSSSPATIDQSTSDMLPLGADQASLPFSPREQTPPAIYEDPMLVNGSYNSIFQPPNDEPPRGPYNLANAQGFQPIQSNSNDQTMLGAQTPSIQYPPSSQSRAPIMTPSFLLGASTMVLVLLIALLSLVHYRRSMRMFFYSNYGLNIFSASKSHKSAMNSLGKHHHNPHISHQYGVGSSAGSTSSSSAASSNMSQALCQQQTSNGAAGLVTTPLIISNSSNNQVLMNSAISPYQDDDRLFDAYVSYSKSDEQFINDYIAPELEFGQPPYRVALHYRDLPVTTNEFLTDCIIETANASRRVIMVVSEQLLRTEWMQYEFRSAHLEALRNNPRHRLIIVLLGQPSVANLDADLIAWLKTCTCISWGDKMFWQRLRFAMPDLPFNRQAGGNYLRYQTLAPHQQQQQQQQQAKMKTHNLGANLLKSAGGLLGGGGGNHNHQTMSTATHHNHQIAGHQSHLVSSNSVHRSLSRPLPQPMGMMSASGVSLQPEEHHYAHLTPATMIQQQQQQHQHQAATAAGHAYHQPIYGDPQQQQQQQQQTRESAAAATANPVHI